MPSGRRAIDNEVKIRLAQISHTLYLAHDIYDLIALLFQQLEIVAVELNSELAFNTRDGFFHVVFDRLREIPDHTRDFFQFAIHGGNQFVLILVKDGPPLILRLQVHKIFGIEKTSGVGAVIRAAHLRDDLRYLRKFREYHTGLIYNARSFRGTRARSQGSARPYRSFVKMREKFRTDHTAKSEK